MLLFDFHNIDFIVDDPDGAGKRRDSRSTERKIKKIKGIEKHRHTKQEEDEVGNEEKENKIVP